MDGRAVDDVEAERLLVDLDDQTVLCRRQSAAVIEQVFDAIDITQLHAADRPARANAQQSYCSQGNLYQTCSTTRKLLWFEIIKVMIAVKNKFVVLFITVFGTLPFTVVRTVFYTYSCIIRPYRYAIDVTYC